MAAGLIRQRWLASGDAPSGEADGALDMETCPLFDVSALAGGSPFLALGSVNN